MNVAVDTNILAYTEEVNGAARRADALAVLRRLPKDSTFLPVQVLEELFNVLVRKGGMAPATA